MHKLMVAVAAFSILGSTATGATFSAGGGAGTSIVDANGTGDYTSLAAAAADFTGYTGGSTGNWTLLIRSDLTETTTSLFGNNTNGFNVTMRPATGTSVTVSFVIQERPSTSADVIWDGCIVLGPSKLTGDSESSLDPNAIMYMDTDNFTIDGCNTPGGTARNLTLLTPDEATTTSVIPRITVRVVGSCDNSIIRNTTMISNVVGSPNDAYLCVLYNSRFISEGALFYLPQNARLENCGLEAAKGSNGRGVYSFGLGASSTGLDAIRGMVVTDNDIHVSHRAVQYGFNADGEISYNRIRVTQETAGQRPEVIIHTGSNNVTFPWTSNIIGNHISQVVARHTTGFNYIIGCGGVPDTNLGVTFNIINNMIGGITGTETIDAAGSILGRAIALESSSKFINFNIRHNSISMADIPNYGPTVDDSGNRMAVLSFLNSNAYSGNFNFENNIVSYRQHNASLINSRANATAAQLIAGTLTFNNNTYHLGAGAKFAEFNNVTYNTLADWQGAGYDAASNSADPLSPPAGGAWISDSDLHFTADPAAAFKTSSVIAGITTDIDMNPRPAANVTKGADEFALPNSGVSDWSIY